MVFSKFFKKQKNTQNLKCFQQCGKCQKSEDRNMQTVSNFVLFYILESSQVFPDNSNGIHFWAMNFVNYPKYFKVFKIPSVWGNNSSEKYQSPWIVQNKTNRPVLIAK